MSKGKNKQVAAVVEQADTDKALAVLAEKEKTYTAEIETRLAEIKEFKKKLRSITSLRASIAALLGTTEEAAQ